MKIFEMIRRFFLNWGRSSTYNHEKCDILCKLVSQLDKCPKFMSIQGDKNDCTLYKMTPRNPVNFRHLSGCDTIVPDLKI